MFSIAPRLLPTPLTPSAILSGTLLVVEGHHGKCVECYLLTSLSTMLCNMKMALRFSKPSHAVYMPRIL